MDKSINLRLILPLKYPQESNPVVELIAPTVSKSTHHELQTKLNDILSSLGDSSEERLLELVESFISFIPSLTQSEQPPQTSRCTASSVESKKSPIFIILIWFHHLLSTTKRKSILALDSLRGVSKPGYPGILILQGQKDLLDDAVTELKGMRWQAMQVRAELEFDEKRLDPGIHEVESVAEVVERMELLGLGDWCLSALRMAR